MTTHTSPLEPGHIYASIDEAVHAATCLCSLHPDGVTVYGTTDPSIADPTTGEAYQVFCKATRRDGTTWACPELPYGAIYTITRGVR